VIYSLQLRRYTYAARNHGEIETCDQVHAAADEAEIVSVARSNPGTRQSLS
jgi:hypothetical protein